MHSHDFFPSPLCELLGTQTLFLRCLSHISAFLFCLLLTSSRTTRKGFTIPSHCLPRYSPSKFLPNATSRKRVAIGGLCINSLLSVGASYLRKTATAFRWCHAPGLPERNLFVKARWVPALLTEMSSLSVFSSSHAPLVSGSSPAQAELGFSLGPQSHVCSQLSTSNTGDREARHLDASREIERAKQTCFIPLGHWVCFSFPSLRVKPRAEGKKEKHPWNRGPKEKFSHFREF